MAHAPLCSLQDVRAVLDKSQSEMASLLGISVRAVQSYEQGWRPLPPNVQKMAALMLFLNHAEKHPVKPCYSVMHCSKDCRDACPASGIGGGKVCWLVTGTTCRGVKTKNWQAKIAHCVKCPVTAQWLP